MTIWRLWTLKGGQLGSPKMASEVNNAVQSKLHPNKLAVLQAQAQILQALTSRPKWSIFSLFGED